MFLGMGSSIMPIYLAIKDLNVSYKIALGTSERLGVNNINHLCSDLPGCHQFTNSANFVIEPSGPNSFGHIFSNRHHDPDYATYALAKQWVNNSFKEF